MEKFILLWSGSSFGVSANIEIASGLVVTGLPKPSTPGTVCVSNVREVC